MPPSMRPAQRVFMAETDSYTFPQLQELADLQADVQALQRERARLLAYYRVGQDRIADLEHELEEALREIARLRERLDG